MYFPKKYTVLSVSFAALFLLGLLIFVYFQGGVDSAIHLPG